MHSIKWDNRFMEMAKMISTWSKDPSTAVGAVIVAPKNRTILSVGYNGFPRGIIDDGRLYDRHKKYSLIVHAEMNAIYSAGAIGAKLDGSTIYVYGLPVCNQCSLAIIQSGISRVVVKEEFLRNERWEESWKMTKSNFDEVNIKIKIL